MAPRPGDGPAELVFVSYSHHDAVWVQRFEVLLKPLLRKRRLRLWVDDAALRAGDTWRCEIDEAIARSTAALLLVSGDFLASDFVMDKELPALERHGVRLLPVLVGDCLWDEEAALEERQWLHDPGRDGPLGRDAADPSRRDERMVAMCRKLVAALPVRPPDDPAPTTTTTAGPVAAVPEGTTAGELSDVPDAPPGYVVRDELAALIDDVTAVDTGAVGVTAAVGLLGQGGIGKSVLAAALGRDERIRRRFPDGVFWVTVGERADLLAVQLDLLNRLESTETAPRTIVDATTRLQEALAAKRVLLLVDDVWSDAAAHAFRVTGSQGRVVYTTRDRRVVAAVGAHEHPINVLSVDAARAVAAAVIEMDPAALPDAANRAFDEVDRVALAVALLAAAVRGGRSWHEVADALRGEIDVYGDHPYANTFKAMQIAVAGLSADLGVALLSLAVFPPDTTIPVRAVERYWAHTRSPNVDTVADLDRLAAANVLRSDGDTIGFHDLQHDYLLLHAPGLPTLHADLLGAYRALLPTDADGWWALPSDEPYVWDHLVAHLAGAGDRRALAATVTDPAYLARRIGGSGLHAAEADLARAAEVMPEHRTIDWWRRWVARHAEFFAGSGEALAESAAPTMRAWLRADPTRPRQVDPDRLLPLLTTPYLEVRWGLASPEPALERVLTGHSEWVRAVDWSPDGALIVTGSWDESARLWDPNTGQSVALLDDHASSVNQVAWSLDGRHLATAEHYNVTIRDTLGRATGRSINCPEGVLALSWSPDSRLLAIAGGDSVCLWDAFEQRVVQNLAGEFGSVTSLAWSHDSRLAAAGASGVVRIWDRPRERKTADASYEFDFANALSWSPDGRTIAVGAKASVYEWKPADNTITVLRGHTQSVVAIAYSPDGVHLATGSQDRTVRVWNPITGRSTVLSGHTDWVFGLAWAPDGRRLASSGDDHTVRIWNIEVPEGDSTPDRVADWIRSVAVSADGHRLATLGGDPYGTSTYVVQIWDVATATATTVDTDTESGDSAVTWSPDARHLLLFGRARGVRRWELATGRTDNAAATHEAVSDAVWAPDGARYAVASDDGTVRVHVLGSLDQITLTGPRSDVAALAWSADSTHVATAHGGIGRSNGGITVWQADTGRIKATIEFFVGSATIAWSPDGTRIAVSNFYEPPVLWTPASGATTALAAPAGGIAWSPDGTHIVTSDFEGAVVVQRTDGTSRTRIQLAGANCVDWAGSTIAVGQRNGPAVLELRDPSH